MTRLCLISQSTSRKQKPSPAVHWGLQMAAASRRATSPAGQRSPGAADRWETGSQCSSKSETQKRKNLTSRGLTTILLWVIHTPFTQEQPAASHLWCVNNSLTVCSPTAIIKLCNYISGLTWPAWDSDPGLQPKPPSKFIQDKTNSTALSTFIVSILPLKGREACESSSKTNILVIKCWVLSTDKYLRKTVHEIHTSNASVATAQKENRVSISPVDMTKNCN